MFQFTNSPLLLLCIHNKILEVCSSRFPHSDIPGLTDICSSPRLFAAYHVLLRLSVPRHSPYALGRLTRNILLFNFQVSWWRWGDSNSWPPACKAGALPTELHPQNIFCDSKKCFGGFAYPALKFTKIYFCINFIDWVHPHSIIIKYLLLIIKCFILS